MNEWMSQLCFIKNSSKFIVAGLMSKLKIQDINLLIKQFAYKIQQRIQELNIQHFQSYTFDDDNPSQFQSHERELDILRRYSSYHTTSEQELKYTHKFIHRIVEIFDFFKERATPKNQLQLNQVSNLINQKAKEFVTEGEAQLGKLLDFMHSLTIRGTLNRIVEGGTHDRKRLLTRPIGKEPSKKSIRNTHANGVPSSNTCLHPNPHSNLNSRSNANPHSNLNLPPNPHHNLNSQSTSNNTNRHHHQPTVQPPFHSRRAISVISALKPFQKPSSSGSQRKNREESVTKLYSILNIDKYYVLRVTDNPQNARKQLFKKNTVIQFNIRNYQKQLKQGKKATISIGTHLPTNNSHTAGMDQPQATILCDVKNKFRKNGWANRKKKYNCSQVRKKDNSTTFIKQSLKENLDF